MSELAEVIKDNPGCHIHYWDNGSWAIYPAGAQEYWDGDQQGSGPEPETLVEGDDFGMNGYAGELVTALAELLGLTVGSV